MDKDLENKDGTQQAEGKFDPKELLLPNNLEQTKKKIRDDFETKGVVELSIKKIGPSLPEASESFGRPKKSVFTYGEMLINLPKKCHRDPDTKGITIEWQGEEPFKLDYCYYKSLDVCRTQVVLLNLTRKGGSAYFLLPEKVQKSDKSDVLESLYHGFKYKKIPLGAFIDLAEYLEEEIIIPFIRKYIRACLTTGLRDEVESIVEAAEMGQESSISSSSMLRLIFENGRIFKTF